MRIIDREAVFQALPMAQAIEAMKQTFYLVSSGKVEMPLRIRIAVQKHDAVSLFMPAYIQESPEALAIKIVSVYPGNQLLGIPLIHAAVLVLDASTGKPTALIEGSALTAIRTGAAGGAAIDLLARTDSESLAIFGAGIQSRTQLEAACTVRNIKRVRIYDPNPEQSRKFIDYLQEKYQSSFLISSASDSFEAVTDADIICAATTASRPVFRDIDLKPGVHINGIGSYTPGMQEIPAETILRGKVVVDSRIAAPVESGDLSIPIEKGLFRIEDIHAELGEIVSGRINGRESEEEITIFKSVGIAAQDAVAANLVLSNAIKLNIGHVVRF